jgi:tripartite-type tricarboxylate transporter receptor subunit TctC
MKKIVIMLILCMSQIANAQTIKITVPFAVGGAFDVLARMYAKFAEKEINKDLIIENVVGAGGIIGTKHHLKSPPNNLMITSSSFYSHIIREDFKLNEFMPVSIIAEAPLFLLVNKSKNFTCEKLRVPNIKYSIGSNGKDSITSTPANFVIEKYPNVLEIPYKGMSQASMDLLGNHIDAMFISGLGLHRPEFDILATTSKKPFDKIITLKDCLGIEKTVQTQWLMFASPGSTEDFIRQVNLLTIKFVNDKETRMYFKDNGMLPTAGPLSTVSRELTNELEDWRKLNAK